MSATDKIKVLVLGDSGVGKTSLVHLIAHDKPISSWGNSWTIGASIEVKLHEYQEGTPSQRSVFIELWDVGGSRGHILARPVLYNQLHGIILVHDSTNSKSLDNLRKWMGEVFHDPNQVRTETINLATFLGAPADEPLEFDREQFVEKNIPVLIAATKVDLVPHVTPTRRHRTSSLGEECSADEIHVDCTQVKSIAPGSTNAVKLSRFFG